MKVNTKVSFVKSIRSFFGGSAVTYKGAKLPNQQRRIAYEALALWACIIADNVCVEDDRCVLGRILTLYKKSVNVDLFALLTNLDLASQYFVEAVASKEMRRYESFKEILTRKEYRVEQLDILAGLLRPYVHAWWDSKDLAAFAKVREILEFPKRLTLKFDDLATTAFESWCEVERSLTPVVPVEEKRIAQTWFPIEDTAIMAENFVPHHGSGAVFEGNLSNGEKYFLNGVDSTLSLVLTELGWELPSSMKLMQNIWYLPVEPGVSVDGGDTIAAHKLLFVPKSYKTYRSVSMEPVAYQFFEEGAAWSIFQYLKDPDHHCPLRYHYCVDTESRNRDLARQGSVDGDFSTIDLSSASDTVTLSFVEQCLGETCLYPFVNLRTKYAYHVTKEDDYLDGDKEYISVYGVDKFAPMGSALCFPIETIVFALITEASVRSTPGVSCNYAVYGDDIVLPTPAVAECLKRLKAYGFKPNMTKSFFNSREDDTTDFFRESCGGEYLNGEDVTPCRLSRKFAGLTQDVSSRSLPQLISMANDLFNRPTARLLIVDEIVNQSKLPVLFDGDGLRGIKTSQPTNYRLERRWNNDYQEWEVKALVLRTKRKQLRYHEDGFLGEVRLYEYLRLAYQSGRTHLLYPEDMVDERVDPYSTELVAETRWVTAPDPATTAR